LGVADDYSPMMSNERVRLLRMWHDHAYEMQRAALPARMSFMGLELHIAEDVFAPSTDDPDGDPYHQAVEAEVRPGDRMLDMGTGSGVSAILAARAGAEVVAVDVNPKAVECARQNAQRNEVGDRITFVVGDIFDGVTGQFDLIVFDPPFRWFKPRDLLEMGTADENYKGLTRFMAQAKDRLRNGGRILLNFGTSGDIDYLYNLIERAGLHKEVIPYGEATRDGMTAHYCWIRLTA
jgi:release factor glutamine methyltransferase